MVCSGDVDDVDIVRDGVDGGGSVDIGVSSKSAFALFGWTHAELSSLISACQTLTVKVLGLPQTLCRCVPGGSFSPNSPCLYVFLFGF